MSMNTKSILSIMIGLSEAHLTSGLDNNAVAVELMLTQ